MNKIRTVTLPDGAVFSMSDWGDYPLWSRIWNVRVKFWHNHLEGAKYPNLDPVNALILAESRKFRKRLRWYPKAWRRGEIDYYSEPTMIHRMRLKLYPDKYKKPRCYSGDDWDSPGIGALAFGVDKEDWY